MLSRRMPGRRDTREFVPKGSALSDADFNRLLDQVHSDKASLENDLQSLIDSYKTRSGGFYPLISLYPGHHYDEQDQRLRLSLTEMDEIREGQNIDYFVIRDLVNCVTCAVLLNYMCADFFEELKVMETRGAAGHIPYNMIIFYTASLLAYFNINYQSAIMGARFTYPSGYVFIGILTNLCKIAGLIGLLCMGASLVTFKSHLGVNKGYYRIVVYFFSLIFCHVCCAVYVGLLLWQGCSSACKHYVLKHVAANLLCAAAVFAWLMNPREKCEGYKNFTLHIGCIGPRSIFVLCLQIPIMICNATDFLYDPNTMPGLRKHDFFMLSRYKGQYFIMALATIVGCMTTSDTSATGGKFLSILWFAIISFLLTFVLMYSTFRWTRIESEMDDVSGFRAIIIYFCYIVQIVSAGFLGAGLGVARYMVSEDKFPKKSNTFFDEIVLVSVILITGCQAVKRALFVFDGTAVVQFVHVSGFWFLHRVYDERPNIQAYQTNLLLLLFYTALTLVIQGSKTKINEILNNLIN